MKTSSIPGAADEFENTNFGDLRLTRRLMRIAERASALPSAGFPEIARSDGELEGVYRFLGNERVTPARILAPHLAATVARAANEDVVVAHDTTEMKFGGAERREGLGRIRNAGGAQGFFAHYALAIGREGARPLGVVGLKTFVRPWNVTRVKKRVRDKSFDNESAKWTEIALDVTRHMPRAVHVMDREADTFTVVNRLIEGNARFVIRLCRDKTLVNRPELLFAAAKRAPIFATRSVRLSRRARNRCATLRKLHPPREERVARLELRAAPFTLRRPKNPKYACFPAAVTVNVVTVTETAAPAGDEPVSWQLVTTEPIETPAEVEAVVDAYRVRWAIEVAQTQTRKMPFASCCTGASSSSCAG